MFKRHLMFATIILMDILAGTEFDIFVPSFAELQNHFSLSPFWVEALLSVNFIGYFFSLFIVGNLADHYGRKKIILLGLICFISGTIFCLLAQSYVPLIVGRFLQGVGIAAPAILSFLIIADMYPIKKQQSIFSILNGVMNASAGAAPILGSYITLYYKWRGNFIALLILGVIVLIMTHLFIPHKEIEASKEKIYFWQGYLDIFKAKPLVLLMTSMILMFVPYWIFVGLSPLLYVKDLQVSLAHFGYYQGVLALVFAIGSICCGLIMDKLNRSMMLYSSVYLWIVSFIMIGTLVYFKNTNPLLITTAVLIYVIGHIMPSAINYPVCLNYLPGSKGKVSAILQGVRLVLAAIGLQIAGYFYNGSFQSVGIAMNVFLLGAIITLLVVLNSKYKNKFWLAKSQTQLA